MRIFLTILIFFIPLKLLSEELHVLKENHQIDAKSFTFIVEDQSDYTFHVKVAYDVGRHTVFILSATIMKPPSWSIGRNPFPDENGDGKRNILDVFPQLIILDTSGIYQQGITSGDAAWGGSFEITSGRKELT